MRASIVPSTRSKDVDKCHWSRCFQLAIVLRLIFKCLAMDEMRQPCQYRARAASRNAAGSSTTLAVLAGATGLQWLAEQKYVMENAIAWLCSLHRSLFASPLIFLVRMVLIGYVILECLR